MTKEPSERHDERCSWNLADIPCDCGELYCNGEKVEPSEEKNGETYQSISCRRCGVHLLFDWQTHGSPICSGCDDSGHTHYFEDAKKEIKSKLPFLRQMVNERPEGRTFTTEDLGFMLGLNTMEEVDEARRRDREIMNEVKKHL